MLKTTLRSIKALLYSKQYIFLLLFALSFVLTIAGVFTGNWIFAGLGFFALCLSLLVGINRLYKFINDTKVPLKNSLLLKDWPRRVMVIFPHPDDEFTIAGTIRMLVEQQISVTLVYLTSGNAGVTAGLTQGSELVKTRSSEMERARQILGADHLEILNFGDGQLAATDPEALREAIKILILKHEPSVILTYDTQAGLYGHADHITAAIRTHEVCQSGEAFQVKRIYAVTLPPNMLQFYLLISPIFQLCFHRFAQSLPEPSFAVDIRPYSSNKKKTLLAHRTQWRVLELLVPLFYLIPARWYFRMFDREYFYILFERGAVPKKAIMKNTEKVQESQLK